MKTISLHQPWASAIALGLKTEETRGWATHYRGPLAIHAARKKDSMLWCEFIRIIQHPVIFEGFKSAGLLTWDALPFGAVVATCRLTACRPAFDHIPSLVSLHLGKYDHGRFAWMLQDIKALPNPIPFKGRQGFFECPLL